MAVSGILLKSYPAPLIMLIAVTRKRLHTGMNEYTRLSYRHTAHGTVLGETFLGIYLINKSIPV